MPLNAGFLRGNAFRAVFTQKQIEQFGQVAVQIGLPFDCTREPLLSEQIDKLFKLNADEPLLALGHGLAQQFGPLRIGRGGKLGHAQQHLFEMFVFIGDLPLFIRQLPGAISLRLRVVRGKRMSAQPAHRHDRDQNGQDHGSY